MILATNNPGKIAELSVLLKPISCTPQSELGIPEIEETGLTFVENALLKARHASLYGKGPALADDSGIVVPVLQGEPGIYSARFAKRQGNTLDNNHYLLERLKTVPYSERKAYFYCVIVQIAFPEDPTPLIAVGQWHGFIADHISGQGGFGYDPVFYVPDYRCTAAELPEGVKNKISHRAQALRQLRDFYES